MAGQLVLSQPIEVRVLDLQLNGVSFNGRTAGFEPVNRGSNPRAPAKPEWRKWQPRRFQKPVSSGTCEFKSRFGYAVRYNDMAT